MLYFPDLWYGVDFPDGTPMRLKKLAQIGVEVRPIEADIGQTRTYILSLVDAELYADLIDGKVVENPGKRVIHDQE